MVHTGQWRTYDSTAGAAWMGLECVHDLHGLPPEILLVPLPGHTFGHAAVAVRTPERWLLLAGDAYFYHREMDPQPYCTPGLRFYQWMLEKDRTARLHNQQRLRALRQQHGAEVEVFCSHDVVEFERVAGLPAHLPAGVATRAHGVSTCASLRQNVPQRDHAPPVPQQPGGALQEKHDAAD